MKQFNSRKLRFAPSVSMAIFAVIGSLSLSAGCASDHQQQPVARSVGPAAVVTTPPSQPLTGAELYAINCNRCHPERSPIERRSTEWKTILTHMRVRANLPAAQARLILQYLQDNSGS